MSCNAPSNDEHQTIDRTADDLFTVREVRRDFFRDKVSLREVYRLASEGRLRGFRVGAKVLIYGSSVAEYIRDNQLTRAAEPEPAEEAITPAPPTRRRRKDSATFDLPLPKRLAL
jgi:excisionase family DNA binding protein